MIPLLSEYPPKLSAPDGVRIILFCGSLHRKF